jgi:2-polyprenyl-3-methyl-5-hydroxy-6-metoxy-1,4-benzoquinol methylase
MIANMTWAPQSTALVWEAVACPLCGKVEEKEVLVAASPPGQPAYRLVLCGQCGMGYLNPRPNLDSIGYFYQEEYKPYQPPPPRRLGWWGRTKRFLDRLVLARCYNYPRPPMRWPAKVVATVLGSGLGWGRQSMTALPYQGQGEMLDFGCGSGWYAHRMREQGWKVTGMDMSAHAARQTSERFQIPVLSGSLPHPAVSPESFDLITMGAVLEHVHQPHDVIEAAALALRPGGLLVISVPNLASFGFRYFGRDWWPLDLPRHLLHFSPVTLRRLLEAHGLVVCEERMVARPSWMRRSLALARRRRSGTPRRLLAKLGRLRLIPSLLTQWTVWRNRADCILMSARRPLQEIQIASCRVVESGARLRGTYWRESNTLKGA